MDKLDSSIYVIGGRQKKAFTTPQEEYNRFGTAIIAKYDTNLEGTVKTTYKSPDELCASEDHCSILFKSGSIHGNSLITCTQTEILIYSLNDFSIEKHISLPYFNDVHHVVKTNDDTLLVVVTGLDLIVEIDMEGNTINEWDALNNPLWSRFSREIDYRKILTTKPHDSHPNFVFKYNDDIWVSRFEQRDAQCLTDRTKTIDIGIEKPHDGHVFGNRAFFTTVDGHVVIANLDTLKVEKIVNLHKCAGGDKATGWARGLKIIDEQHILVAFSTLRVTKFRENLRWIKKKAGVIENHIVSPTHFALYDIVNERMLWRKFTDDTGVDVIFSIL